MDQKGEAGQPAWNRDHDHAGGQHTGRFGWGGLLTESCKQSVETMKAWVGQKDGSVRNIPNGD